MEQLAPAALVLVSICAGAGIVLAAFRGHPRVEPAPALDPFALLERLVPLIRPAEPAREANEGELLEVLREERAKMRADFAESIEQAEGVAETVSRHRKRTQQVAKRLEEVELEEPPQLQTPDQRRAQLERDLRAQGLLPGVMQ